MAVGAVHVSSKDIYDLGQRVPTIFNAAGLINPGTGGGGNGQRQMLIPTAVQTINSTSQIAVGANSVPLSCPVVAGKYYLYAEITYVPDFSAATAHLRVTIAGGAAPTLRAAYWRGAARAADSTHPATTTDNRIV